MKQASEKQIAVRTGSDLPPINEISKRMEDGDALLIADVTKLTPDYVRKCMKEKRRNKLVWTIAFLLVENRDEFKKQMKHIAQLIQQDKLPITK
jgi:hypothetical protein